MFVYIQSLLIMMLEILCCKIFFEAFGIKREENNCWKNYSIVIGGVSQSLCKPPN